MSAWLNPFVFRQPIGSARKFKTEICRDAQVSLLPDGCPLCMACRLIGLSGASHFDDLLGTKGAAKKGAMKNATVASRAGTIRRISTKHLGDGKQLDLSMQVWPIP